ncbi:MAG: hypothetical protein KKD50_01385 [Proteobacteria bacterium]|nr:hypothetical protein [Pseudomonadota bacterium]
MEIERIIRENRRYFWDKGPLNPERDKYIIWSEWQIWQQSNLMKIH